MTLWSRLKDAAKLVGIGLIAGAGALAIGESSPMDLMALALFAVLCLVTLRNPLVGLSLLIIMIVSNLSANLIQGFGAPSPAKLAAPGLVALLGVRYVLWGDRPYIGWLSLWLLVGLLALKLFGATYAADWQQTLSDTTDFIKDAIVAMLALAFMGYRKGFETITTSAVLTIAAVCGLGFIQVIGFDLPGGFSLFARFGEFNGRFAGPIEDENFFAVVVVFCVPLALFQLLGSQKPITFLFWSLTTCLLLFGLLATQSRGGILALCVGLGILFLQLRARQKLAAFAVFVAVIMVASVFVGEQAFERLATIGEMVSSGGIDKSTEGRLASWSVAAEIFKAHPWLGVGAGNFNLLYQDFALELGLIFRGEGRSTHSLYLEVLTEQGLLGLMYFLLMIGFAAAGIVVAYRQARAAGDLRLASHMVAFGAGLAGYLAGMTLLHDAYPRFLWIVIVLGIESGRLVRLRLEAKFDTPSGSRAPGGAAPLLLTGSMRVGSIRPGSIRTGSKGADGV